MFYNARNALGRPIRGPLPRVTGVSIISQLHHNLLISSSQDTSNGDQNPYGLALVPRNEGVLEAGDLLVCNFNDTFNIQGLGTTVEYIRPSETHPVPHRFVQDGRITGCEALSITPNDSFLAAATYANLVLQVPSTGIVNNAINLNPPSNWAFPWGTVYAGNSNGSSSIALGYVVNQDGTLWRINETSGTPSFDLIGDGFPVNHGVAPTTLATSGLSWSPSTATLYFVDGDDNSLIAISHPELIPAGTLHRTATGFSGSSAVRAKVLAINGYINAPISTAVLYNGDILVENTGDNNLLEFTSSGGFLGRRLLDGGGPGALFGIVTTGTSLATVKIYFNDDNQNSLHVFEQ